MRATLGYLFDKGNILLGEKKYGGAKGKLNGFGGKIEQGDIHPEMALIREFREETSIEICDPILKGQIYIEKFKGFDLIYVYEIFNYYGSPKESSEMTVNWYNLESIDLKRMWPNDQLWFNLMRTHLRFVMIWSKESIDNFSKKIEIYLLEDITDKSYEKFI